MARIKPRKYQMQAVRRIERKYDGRVLLADEMGLGKTLQSLVTLKRNKRFMLPALVICPASLKWNWQQEAAACVGMVGEVLEGMSPPPVKALRTFDSDLLIINYEILTPWMKFLRRLDPQLIIIDEVHRIKSKNAQCTKNVTNLCRYAPYIFALSGTPMTNQPAELFTTLKVLWPEEFKSFPQFASRYTNVEHHKWGPKYFGGRNLPELHSRLKELGMIRRTKKQVLHELPPRQIGIVPVRLNKTALKEYQEAQTRFLSWLRKKVKKRGKLTAAARAQRLVQIGYLRRLAAELKLDDVKQWINNFIDAEGRKLIVFGVHKAILKPLHERYKNLSILIDGDTSGKKRHLALEEFKHDPNKLIAFVNIQAGGVGLNMQEASDVLFAELPWTPAELDQAISRAHRMGQKRNVQVRLMISKGTIEEKLCRILQEKQSLADQVLDGDKTVNQDMAIFDLLIRELKQ